MHTEITLLFIYFLYYLTSAVRFVSSEPDQSFSCGFLSDTEQSPFVAILLYKSSGRFLAMGGIVDKNTVVTSASAIKGTGGDVENIMVLAGYFSPWWGENAQVRHAHTTHVNEYDVALVEIEPDLIFNRRIRSFPLIPLSDDGGDHTVYGIPTDKDSYSGQIFEKTAFYRPSWHTPTALNTCRTAFPNVPDVTETTHLCLSVNDSSCTGSLGSPVTAIRINSLNPYLLGIIIRSDCEGQMLMVKLTSFMDWIDYIHTNRRL